jgi:hypothetical protein
MVAYMSRKYDVEEGRIDLTKRGKGARLLM